MSVSSVTAPRRHRHALALVPVLVPALVLGVAPSCGRSPQSFAGVEGAIAVADIGLAAPASVRHDPVQDVYFVSSINGAPLAEDGNGFISALAPTGEVLALRWIDGASPDVTLHAPKGMALTADHLVVTDIATLRRFDRRTGEAAGDLPIAGASFLNGIVAADDGSLYFTDTGLRAGPAGLLPAATDAVYRLRPDGVLDTLAHGADLGHPTAIAISGDDVWVVSVRGELYRVADGRREAVHRLPRGALDGLVVYNGDAFVTSSESGVIYRGPLGGPYRELLSGLDSPAALGHDEWRARLLVPLTRAEMIGIVPLIPPAIVSFPE